jgi:hypothetical protein
MSKEADIQSVLEKYRARKRKAMGAAPVKQDKEERPVAAPVSSSEYANQIVCGDCLEVLRTIPDNTFTACVTDPPYGLSDHSDITTVLKAWLDGKPYVHNKKGFMSKDWDGFVPGPEIWREVLRVLKPGGHILSFSGTRSYDLMTMAIRIAGAEIRDKMAFFCEVQQGTSWVQGSGFPKSLNIGKAVEKDIIKAIEESGVEFTEWDDGNAAADSEKIAVMVHGKKIEIQARGGKFVKPKDLLQLSGYGTALKPAHEPIVCVGKDAVELDIDVPFRYTPKVSRKERNLGCEDLFWKVVDDEEVRITKEEYDLMSKYPYVLDENCTDDIVDEVKKALHLIDG